MLCPEPQPKQSSPWPWIVSGSLMVFVCLQLLMVRFAVTSFEGPDEVDYYRMGLEHSKEIRLRDEQRKLGWTLTTRLKSDQLYCQVLDAQGVPVQGNLKVHLKRPATKTQDLTLEGKPTQDGWILDWQPSEKDRQGSWNFHFDLETQGHRWLHRERYALGSMP